MGCVYGYIAGNKEMYIERLRGRLSERGIHLEDRKQDGTATLRYKSTVRNVDRREAQVRASLVWDVRVWN